MFSNTHKLQSAILIASLLILGSCSPEVSDFQSKAFIKYFGNGRGTEGQNVIELPDGGYILVGTDQHLTKRKEIFAAHINKFGNTIWQKTYGTNHDETALVVHSVNNEIFVFGTITHSNTSVSNACMLRLSTNGDSLNMHVFDTSSPFEFNDVIVSSNSFIAVGKELSGSPANENYYICSITPEGVLSKGPNLTAEEDQKFYRIFEKTDGNYLVVGTNNKTLFSSVNRVVVVELSQNQMPLIAYTLPSETDQYFADAVFDGTDLLVLYNIISQGSYQAKVASISASLELNWDNTINTVGTGKTICSFDATQFTLAFENNSNIVLSMLSNQGEILRNSSSFNTLPGSVNRIFKTTDNGLIFIGTTSITYGKMIQLIKTDSELFLLNN
jgi:hypothetical protein